MCSFKFASYSIVRIFFRHIFVPNVKFSLPANTANMAAKGNNSHPYYFILKPIFMHSKKNPNEEEGCFVDGHLSLYSESFKQQWLFFLYITQQSTDGLSKQSKQLITKKYHFVWIDKSYYMHFYILCRNIQQSFFKIIPNVSLVIFFFFWKKKNMFLVYKITFLQMVNIEIKCDTCETHEF